MLDENVLWIYRDGIGSASLRWISVWHRGVYISNMV